MRRRSTSTARSASRASASASSVSAATSCRPPDHHAEGNGSAMNSTALGTTLESESTGCPPDDHGGRAGAGDAPPRNASRRARSARPSRTRPGRRAGPRTRRGTPSPGTRRSSRCRTSPAASVGWILRNARPATVAPAERGCPEPRVGRGRLRRRLRDRGGDEDGCRAASTTAGRAHRAPGRPEHGLRVGRTSAAPDPTREGFWTRPAAGTWSARPCRTPNRLPSARGPVEPREEPMAVDHLAAPTSPRYVALLTLAAGALFVIVPLLVELVTGDACADGAGGAAGAGSHARNSPGPSRGATGPPAGGGCGRRRRARPARRAHRLRRTALDAWLGGPAQA